MKTAAIRIHALAKSLGVSKTRVVGHDIGLITIARSAAMRAENAKPFTSAPKESPIGSSPLPPTTVDFPPMRVAMCSVIRLIGTSAGAAVFSPDR
jgi:hypothetical protein